MKLTVRKVLEALENRMGYSPEKIASIREDGRSTIAALIHAYNESREMGEITYQRCMEIVSGDSNAQKTIAGIWKDVHAVCMELLEQSNFGNRFASHDVPALGNRFAGQGSQQKGSSGQFPPSFSDN